MNGAENSKKLKKVRVEVTVDEEWPVFYLHEVSNHSRNTIELPEDFYQEYLLARCRYEEIQLKLKDFYDAQSSS